MTRRVVFDTTTIVSSLCFDYGRLAWLRIHWREGGCTPLLSPATATELLRVLCYPKFKLSVGKQEELIADYFSRCERLKIVSPCMVICRDPRDQPFLDLAHSAKADVLVSGDSDLLVLAGQTEFVIETPEAYRHRAATND